jgi:hypothetical protein
MADSGRAERRGGGEERHERLEIAEQCETERASSRGKSVERGAELLAVYASRELRALGGR